MAPKSNAPVAPMPKTNLMRSPLKDQVRSGSHTTTPKKG